MTPRHAGLSIVTQLMRDNACWRPVGPDDVERYCVDLEAHADDGAQIGQVLDDQDVVTEQHVVNRGTTSQAASHRRIGAGRIEPQYSNAIVEQQLRTILAEKRIVRPVVGRIPSVIPAGAYKEHVHSREALCVRRDGRRAKSLERTAGGVDGQAGAHESVEGHAVDGLGSLDKMSRSVDMSATMDVQADKILVTARRSDLEAVQPKGLVFLAGPVGRGHSSAKRMRQIMPMNHWFP